MAAALCSQLIWGPGLTACTLAQAMFYEAVSFDQPVNAWDVGKVTSMWVRCRPSRGLGGRGYVSSCARAVE